LVLVYRDLFGCTNIGGFLERCGKGTDLGALSAFEFESIFFIPSRLARPAAA